MITVDGGGIGMWCGRMPWTLLILAVVLGMLLAVLLPAAAVVLLLMGLAVWLWLLRCRR